MEGSPCEMVSELLQFGQTVRRFESVSVSKGVGRHTSQWHLLGEASFFQDSAFESVIKHHRNRSI